MLPNGFWIEALPILFEITDLCVEVPEWPVLGRQEKLQAIYESHVFWVDPIDVCTYFSPSLWIVKVFGGIQGMRRIAHATSWKDESLRGWGFGG